MEKLPYRETSDTSLGLRLFKATQLQGVARRQLRQVEPLNLPSPKINLESVGAAEMFVMLVEGAQRYKT
ncbi:MAG: hypothetical protein ACHQT7_02715, partial [Candidatus Levyibacteriota bacterium]